jgi:hypothetical protein
VTNAFARRLVAASLSAVFTVAVSAPAFAAESSAAPPARPTLLASGKKQVQQLAAVPAPARSARQQGTAGQGYDSPGSFFSTKRGIALLVLAGAGIGYMWYSKVHDRIHSVERARVGE